MTQQIVSDRAAGRRKPEPAGKSRGVWPGNPAVALWRTTVGKKIVMAVTGVILVGFVIAHMLGNLKIFLGAEDFNAYAVFLRTMGEPLFPYSVLLWTARIILLVSVVLHIVGRRRADPHELGRASEGLRHASDRSPRPTPPGPCAGAG